ncbi:polysaccharide deacetylase family protein [Paenibacillus sp. CC-CFT747]|nr:polysaccharide deacetylase family protein [Paenibacillus sp. CC-CFT747]
MDVLREHHVQATFFVVGWRAEKYPDVIRRMVREGHIIGNHSYSHADLSRLSDSRFETEIRRTEMVIHHLTGYTPKLVRPPYGSIKEHQLLWLESRNSLVTNWNVDSLDWRGLKAHQVTRNVLSTMKPGAIILQHSAGEEALT